MKKEKRKRMFWVITGTLIGAAVLLLFLKLALPSKEYMAIQSIIQGLPAYQEEIESWGYQVSVFDPVRDNVSEEDKFALIHYADGVYKPVLILTNQTNEQWFFYDGFDQYVREETRIDLAPNDEGDEEMLRIVLQLRLCKTNQNRPPLKENHAKQGSRGYYDVKITLYDDRYSLETGEHIRNPNGNVSTTQYCSKNFEECKLFYGIDPESANRESNRDIKKRFTAEQLLGFYQQGLELQEKLIELSEQR